MASFAFSQADTITGWNFIDPADVEFNANMGLSGNLGYDMRAEDTSFVERTSTLTNGANGTDDYALTAEDWQDGANAKYWSIKFKADGYGNFKLWSKQRSGNTNPGPKYFKAQCRLGSGAWMDIVGGDITVGNDWTTGVLTEVALPVEMNHPGTLSIRVRWIMTSNEGLTGVDVDSLGTSKIDEVLVTGEDLTGVQTVLFEDMVSVYPNPSNGIVNIESPEEIAKVILVNNMGQIVGQFNGNTNHVVLNSENQPEGLYFAMIFFHNDNTPTTKRIIISK
ncbi:MAG: hypothetical protein A2W91_03945 [Bacteroidetes bacterium GWF2_38_335]|nr:MAG: hypothetical protein A2W91_03945 [Bacteroidetes bacterium GWF2_38_335]OFY79104.1 MAG: hypothetical protein A2281_03280 [Bacteroidetes bacterium RIFOXYA12_FULL_38_20]